MQITKAAIATLISNASTTEQLVEIATEHSLTLPTSTELEAARLELQGIVNSHPDDEEVEKEYDTFTPEMAKELNAPMKSSSTSTYFDKEQFGNKTVTGIALVNSKNKFVKYVRSSDGQESAANIAMFITVGDRQLVTFITPDDFNLIRTSGKPTDIPNVSGFDLYSGAKTIGAMSYRIPLTSGGKVKSV